jgi:hypothetical protein
MNRLGRKSCAAGVFLSVAAAATLMAPSQRAYAEMKAVTATGTAVAVRSETTMYPGDSPQHLITVRTRLDKWTSSDPNFDGALVNFYTYEDYTGLSGPHRGYNATARQDDQMFASFEGTTDGRLNPDGSPNATFQGKFRFIGGTGKFKGLAGSGTYTGTLTSAGVSYQFQGEYGTQ